MAIIIITLAFLFVLNRGIVSIIGGLGQFLLKLFGKADQPKWNYQVPFFFLLKEVNKMAKKDKRDMGFWETLLAIFLLDWLF